MRLIYEWIFCDEKKLLNKCGINFTDDYSVSYDAQKRVLHIEKKPSDISRGFYTLSENVISQVTCFVGKNGSGKTSLLSHLFKSDPCRLCPEAKSNSPQPDTIQVYEFEDGLHVCHNRDDLEIICSDPSVSVICDRKDKIEKRVSKIFFSNNALEGLNRGISADGYQSNISFTPYDMRVLQWEFFDHIAGMENSFLIRRTPYYLFGRRLKEYSDPLYLYNIFYLPFLKRLFLAEKKGEFGYLDDAQLSFLKIGDLHAFTDFYHLYEPLLSAEDLEKIIARRDAEDVIARISKQIGIRNFDREMLYFCAVHQFAAGKLPQGTVSDNLRLNLATELLLALSEYEADLCNLPSCEPEALLALLKKRAAADDGEGGEIGYFANACESVRRAEEFLRNEKDERIFAKSNPAFLDFLEEELVSENSFPLKYLRVDVNCSSGERAFLNIFASLNFIPYWQYCSDYAPKEIGRDIVLFLDEPDLHCHPEWQRKLLYQLIRMFEMLYRNKSVHIIMSTHSPLFLSDIPNGNILLLDRNKRNELTIRQMKKKSFGANLFDLYNDGFYLEEFIGQFAKEKIEKAIKSLRSKNLGAAKAEELRKFIALIGEPILRNSMRKLLPKGEGRT